MVNARLAILVIAVVAGVAIGGALFLFYPDMMFQGTSIAGQSGSSLDGTTTSGILDAGAGDLGGMPPP